MLIGLYSRAHLLPLSAVASTSTPSTIRLVHSESYQVAQLRTEGVHSLQPADEGPVVLKVARVTGASYSGVEVESTVFTPWTNN